VSAGATIFVICRLNSLSRMSAFLSSFTSVLPYRADYCAELVTIFDGYKYIGTMQICVARMLKESGIFFAVSEFLLSPVMEFDPSILPWAATIGARLRIHPGSVRIGRS